MPISWQEIQNREEELYKEREKFQTLQQARAERTELPHFTPPQEAKPQTQKQGLTLAEINTWEQNREPGQDPFDDRSFLEKTKAAALDAAQLANRAREATGAAMIRTIGSTARASSGIAGIFDPLTARLTFEDTKELRRKRQAYEDWIGDITQQLGHYTPETEKDIEEGKVTPGVVFEKSLDVAGSLLKAYAVGQVAGPWAAAATLGAEEGGNTRADVLQRLNDRDDISDESKQAIATTSGVLVGLTSTVLERLPMEALGAKLSTKVGKKAMGQLLMRFGRLPAGAGTEAAEEMLTGTMQDTARYVLENDADAYTGFVNRRLEEGLYGALGFGMARGATVTGQISQSYKAKISRIKDAVAQAGSTEAGRAKLEKLAEKEKPSRKDLRDAGVKVKGNVNAAEREAIAKAADPATFNTTMHRVQKLAGRSIDPETMHQWDRDLVVEQASRGDVDGLQSMGLSKEAAIRVLKDRWLQDDRVKQPARISGKKEITEPKITRARAKILNHLGEKWKLTENANAEVQETLHEDMVQDLEPVTELGQQLTAARRGVAEESRQERIQSTQAAVQKLQRRRDHYREAAAAARRKGNEDAADAYDRLSTEAARDMTRRLKMLQMSETPRPPGAPETPVPQAPPTRPTAAEVTQPAAELEPGTVTEPAAQPTTGEFEGPRKPLKPITPEILRGEAGTVPLSELSLDNIKQSFSEFGAKIMTPEMQKKSKAGWKAFINEFSPSGHKLPEISTVQKESEFRLNRMSNELKQTVVDYLDAAKLAAGDNSKEGVADRLANLADQYLKGNIELDTLPEPMRVPTKRMREKIDSLSREALNSGAVTGGKFLGSVQARTAFFDQLRQHIKTGMDRKSVIAVLKERGLKSDMAEMVASILHNDGLYITRTFDAFDKNAKWKERMPDSIKTEMADMLRREDTARRSLLDLRNQKRLRQGKPTHKIPPPITDEQIAWKMNKILEDALSEGDMKPFAKGQLGRQNRQNLKKRKNLTETYRKFLGEKKDPVENFITSGVKVGQLIEKFKVAQNIREAGLGKFLWTEEDAPYVAEQMAVSQITSEGDMAMEPLAGLYATPQVKKMFEQAATIFDSKHRGVRLLAGWYGLESMFQRMKTSWSPQSHMRQYVGNPLDMMANGNFTDAVKQFFGRADRPSTWQTAMTGRGTEEQREFWNEGAEFGVISGGVEHQMQRHWSKRKSTAEEIMEETLGKTMSKIPSAPEKLGNVLQEQYGYEDDMYKLADWQAEQDKYADTGMFDLSTDEGVRQLKEHTAKIVRRTMPTYSELPPIVDHVRSIPGVGMFMAFPTAQAMNAVNRVSQTLSEINNKHPDPIVRQKIRDIGRARAVAQAMVYSLPAALAAAFKAISGMTDEEDKAFREVLPPWARDATLLHLGKDSKGLINYINWSYVDPHAFFLDPIYSILRGDTSKEVTNAMGRAAGKFLSPYLQETMGASTILDLARNKTPYGSEVYEPDAPTASKIQDIMWHAARGTIMPGGLISAGRIYKAATGERSKGGKAYNLPDEITSVLTGFKLERFDTKTGFDFAINDFKKRLQKSVNWRLDREGNIPEWKQARIIADRDYMRKTAITEMHDMYENYRIINPDIDYGYLVDKLAAKRIKKDDIQQVFTGQVKYEVPPTLKVMDRIINMVKDPARLQELKEHREAKLNDLAYSVGDVERDGNIQAIKNRVEELQERGITGREALIRMITKMRMDQLERYVTDLKSQVGNKYSDELIRKTAVRKQGLNPFRWTKPRRARAVRLAKLFDIESDEFLEIIGAAS